MINALKIAEVIAEHNGGEAEDYAKDAELLLERASAETLADWENSMDKHWAECRRFERVELCGVNCVVADGVQTHKGAQRRDLLIIEADAGHTMVWPPMRVWDAATGRNVYA